LDVSQSLLTKPITPPMEVQPATTDLPVPDTVQLSGHQPPKVTESGLHAPARSGKGSGVPKAVPRQPGETVRQPVSPFGGDRVDRSTLQVVDLDPSTPRSRLPLSAGAEFWLVADSGSLTDALAERLKTRGLNVRVLAWSAASATRSPTG